MSLAAIVLAFVTVQRLGELVLARRNTVRLLARGGLAVADGHYPLIVVLHASWLAGLWLLAHDAPVSLSLLAVFVVLQVCRLWVIASLGERWTTRIIVLPGVAPVRSGPYRFMNHPNYVVVAAEVAILPLALGLPLFALAFSLINAVLLWIRIRAENRALRRAAGADAGDVEMTVRQAS